MQLRRTPHRARAQMTPKPVPDEAGLFVVDATWGTINPIEIEPGVETVGELEVIAHLESGGRVIDTRPAPIFAKATLPGATNIPHGEMGARIREVPRDERVILFCNGPQCSATPDAIRALLDTGHPADGLLYYRGGIHDWVTLGLPLAPG
jgi:rhodanese-related sulfurtransferase